MRELAVYVAAGVVYIALGVAFPDLLLSWVEGAAFLLLAVWLLPTLVRRARS
jgi:putative Ca2+/H+ antiporter (TMEM165/GDT1 family)